MEFDKKSLETHKQIIGCDEVGRGPLAGPVVGCAVSFGQNAQGILEHLHELKITDSKKLTSSKRHKILKELGIDLESLVCGEVYSLKFQDFPFEFALIEHSPEEIDQMNILQASLSCMRQGASLLASDPSCKVFVDGNKGFEIPYAVEPVIKGDQKYLCISLASIIAKEFRDEKMKVLDTSFPGYGLAKHAGYPTAQHRAAIQELGISPAHRKSFKGVKEHVNKQRGS